MAPPANPPVDTSVAAQSAGITSDADVAKNTTAYSHSQKKTEAARRALKNERGERNSRGALHKRMVSFRSG
ncbi:hypothetical protein EON65_45860 [archaeon]|nr:MAG: hypothetical protein EON65_45860 [archaeon]